MTLGTWVFLSMSSSKFDNLQFGFTYKLDSSGPEAYFTNRSFGVSAIPIILQNSSITYGNDYIFPYCTCSFQYIRVYLDYFPTTYDEMLNLALMDIPGNSTRFN